MPSILTASRFVQYLPQFQYRSGKGTGNDNRDNTAHFAPGDSIEFMDPSKAIFHFHSITSFNLDEHERTELCPLTAAAQKTDGCLATCLGPCIGPCL